MDLYSTRSDLCGDVPHELGGCEVWAEVDGAETEYMMK
jgi:hypothetical protein